MERSLRQVNCLSKGVKKNLNGLWRLFCIFIIVPKFIRDGVYSGLQNTAINGLEPKRRMYDLTLPELKAKF